MMITDRTQDAPEQCPICRAELAAEGACEGDAEARSSDSGLRVDIQCECANCTAEIFLEDIAASEDTLGCVSAQSVGTFNEVSGMTFVHHPAAIEAHWHRYNRHSRMDRATWERWQRHRRHARDRHERHRR